MEAQRNPLHRAMLLSMAPSWQKLAEQAEELESLMAEVPTGDGAREIAA